MGHRGTEQGANIFVFYGERKLMNDFPEYGAQTHPTALDSPPAFASSPLTVEFSSLLGQGKGQ
jgi:hypothetical protein